MNLICRLDGGYRYQRPVSVVDAAD